MSDSKIPPPNHDRLESMLLRAAFVLLSGYEACFTVFFRSHMGANYLAKGFFGGGIVMWLWAENYPAPEMVPFGGVWLLAMLFQKCRSSIDDARGQSEHREYGGDAALIRAIPLIGRCGQTFAKCVIEPGLVFLASYGMEAWSPAMGRFFLWGSVIMLGEANLGRALVKGIRPV